jgi:hypothetical protein
MVPGIAREQVRKWPEERGIYAASPHGFSNLWKRLSRLDLVGR